MDKLTITKIKTKKNKDNYEINGFLYELNRRNKDLVYCRCTTHRNGGCRSTVTLRVTGNNVTVTKTPTEHNHQPQCKEIIKKTISYNLKEAIRSNPEKTLPEVFNQEINTMVTSLSSQYNVSDVACVAPTFEKIRNIMYRKRFKEHFPEKKIKNKLTSKGIWMNAITENDILKFKNEMNNGIAQTTTREFNFQVAFQ